MGIFNYQGLYYDILGISTYGSFDPHDVKHLKELEISGEEVGYLLIKNKEFPYDWDSGEIVYIIFLSVIFSGTIVLEGTYLRLGGSNEISFIRKIKKAVKNLTNKFQILYIGVVTSTMAQVTPSKLNACFINSGLLGKFIV